MVTYRRLIGQDDAVFKALADPGRRRLLDALRDHDGRTLGELCAVLPAMSRFGVMKHLAVLEHAGLVVTHRSGRTKLPLPQPGADPRDPRPLDHQVRRARHGRDGRAAPAARGPHAPYSPGGDRDGRAPARVSRSTSAPPPRRCGRRSPTRRSRGSTSIAPRSRARSRRAARGAMTLPDGKDAVRRRHRGGRPPEPARHDVARAVRRGDGRGAAEPGRVAARPRAARASQGDDDPPRPRAQPAHVGERGTTAGTGSSTH